MNKLPIYYLRNKVYKDAPEGATIIKGSTRVSEHERLGDGVIVKIHLGGVSKPQARLWANIHTISYTQTAIFETAWHEDKPCWFTTYCTGSFSLEQWHQIIESIRPVEEFLIRKHEDQLQQFYAPKYGQQTYSQAV